MKGVTAFTCVLAALAAAMPVRTAASDDERLSIAGAGGWVSPSERDTGRVPFWRVSVRVRLSERFYAEPDLAQWESSRSTPWSGDRRLNSRRLGMTFVGVSHAKGFDLQLGAGLHDMATRTRASFGDGYDFDYTEHRIGMHLTAGAERRLVGPLSAFATVRLDGSVPIFMSPAPQAYLGLRLTLRK